MFTHLSIAKHHANMNVRYYVVTSYDDRSTKHHACKMVAAVLARWVVTGVCTAGRRENCRPALPVRGGGLPASVINVRRRLVAFGERFAFGVRRLVVRVRARHLGVDVL